MTLNNDTRLSRDFVAGMLDPRLPDDTGIVTPVYDDVSGHPHMVSDQRVPASEYQPRPRVREVPIVDGTAMMLTRELWRTVGGFDLRSFSKYGWGIDFDLCLRARAAGFGIYATEMAYINHFGKKTAEKQWGRRKYIVGASLLAQRDLMRLHGRRWARSLPNHVTTLPLDH